MIPSLADPSIAGALLVPPPDRVYPRGCGSKVGARSDPVTVAERDWWLDVSMLIAEDNNNQIGPFVFRSSPYSATKVLSS